MNRKALFLATSIPAILCMIAIFIFSSHTASESSDVSGGLIANIAEWLIPGFDRMTQSAQEQWIEDWQFAVRKTAHFTIYAVLGLLLSLPLSFVLKKQYVFPVALLTAAVYAVSDEIHQYFVPGRSCEVRDMLIDGCGAALGCAVFLLIRKIAQRNKSEK